MTQLEAELKSRLLDLDARVHTLEACLRFNRIHYITRLCRCGFNNDSDSIKDIRLRE